MGCDIHGFMEVKKTVDKQEKWISADYFKKNEYFGVFDEEDGEFEYEVIDAFGDRNYLAFAQLCGVRGYSESNPKISEPRGLPDDVTEMVKKISEEWDCDGHSHSYVTLRDVIDFRKNLKETEVTGMISPEQSKALDDGVTPDYWCGWTNRDNWVKRSWKVMFDPLEELENVMRERAKEFLWAFSKDEQNEVADKVRYVFFFDN